MLVAVAVCPSPPLLVPEVAAGAAVELEPLRAACREALEVVRASAPDLLVLVGGGPETLAVGPGDHGSLAGYGVGLTVPLGPVVCGGAPVLPLSLTVGAWLLRDAGWEGPRQGLVVGETAGPEDLRRAGEELRALPGRVALLVLADGTACRTPGAPGALDPRAAGVDAALARALARADPSALTGLDAGLAAELRLAGRAAFAVLGHAAEGGAWRSRLHHDSAPYGVGYLVASWTASPTGPSPA